MALVSSLAARRGRAIERLTSLMQAIGDQYGISGPSDAIHAIRMGTDPYVAQMLEIEAFNAWAEQLAAKLGVTVPEAADAVEPPPALPFDGMPLSGLQALARDKGLPFNGETTETELRRALRIAHGFPPGDGLAPSVDQVQEDADADQEFGAMTVAELRTLADERRVDVSGLRRKADIIAALRVAEGNS